MSQAPPQHVASTSSTFRYFITFCAVGIGILFAGIDMAMSMPTPPQLPPGEVRQHRQKTPEEMRYIFNVCLIFYGMTYATGRFLYGLLGKTTEANELRRWSRWHMIVLNSFGSCLLLGSVWEVFPKVGLMRPALISAAILALLAIFDLWQALTSKRQVDIQSSS